MGQPVSEKPVNELLDKILGHLNFSSGQHDSKFVANLDGLFRIQSASCQSESACEESGDAKVASVATDALETADQTSRPPFALPSPLIDAISQSLRRRLAEVKDVSSTFRDSVQVETILNLVFEDFLPAYVLHHRDLLFHQSQEFVFNSFFIARVFETVIEKTNTCSSPHAIITASLAAVNDYLGHRPVAVLTSQKIEPYEKEWVAPTPVFFNEVGAALGRYEPLVRQTIEILKTTDPDVLTAAQFDPANLKELSIDPRAFDFDHPVNKRPNHHFGTWDEHHIDNQGMYFRFIVHQITLDSLLSRVEEARQSPDNDISEDELLFEAAAAMAGTMLMGSGISGNGPGAHDSTVTLGSLLPGIAAYRDQFYRSLIEKVPAAHQARLREEAGTRKQIFGSVRQHLNAKLANHRACQLVNCRLASIFARMGHPQAAQEQSSLVPVTSARIICQIDCLLSEANRAIKNGHLKDALDKFPKIGELLQRGIQCGADCGSVEHYRFRR